MTRTAGERARIGRSPALPPAQGWLLWVERLAGAAGILCLLWWGADALATTRFQRDAARMFDAERATSAGDRLSSRARAMTARGSAAPAVIGRIEIPSAHISAMIAPGTEHNTLDRAVGHLSGTALPGEPGRCVLAGHRDTFFRGLGNVRPGDPIRITTRNGVRRYRVTSARIVTRQTDEALDTGPAPGVVLVTCYPFHFIGPAPLRYVVYAAAEAHRPDDSAPPHGERQGRAVSARSRSAHQV